MITKTKTLSNLNNFYKFLNVSPLEFNGLYLSCIDSSNSICGDDDIWSHYEMPLSREKLAEITHKAELEVAEILGTQVKAKWITEEIEVPTTWYKPGTTISLSDIIFKTNYSFLKRAGQKRTEKILSNVSLTYFDDDSDGFNERATATFILPVDEVDNLCDIKLYFLNTEHEIVGFQLRDYNTTTRQVIIDFDSWLLVKPELYFKRFFNKNNTAIDACDSDNFVTSIDVWVDTKDLCKPEIEILYEKSCNGSCELVSQPACMKIINKCQGTFRISPVAYDENNCVTDSITCFTGIAKRIIVHYQAGCYADFCNEAQDCLDLEEIVFKIVAGRYPYPTCDCACVQSVLKTYSQQTSLIVKNEGRVYRYSEKYMNNALLGTTVGEIEAAIALLNIKEKFCNFD